MDFRDVRLTVEGAGFALRGAFHPEGSDGVPALGPERPAATLILVGNAGPGMWRRFSGERDPESDSLDEWSRAALTAIAAEIGAGALFPFTKPPLPFQRWAQKAEDCHPSPIGMFIHPRYGLWHAYRGALILADRLVLPEISRQPNPCGTCSARPCLSTCPVDAFDGTGYDVAACARHLASPDGHGCMNRGCRARHACPIGRSYAYEKAQAQFHMRAFLRTRRTSGII